MPKLHLLFNNFKRIYAVLPVHLHRSIWLLFILMVMLALTELASIMALTGFFSILNAPEQFTTSIPVQKVLKALPALSELFADPRHLILWACLLPTGLIGLKNILSALVAWRSAMLGESVAAQVGNSIMQRFLYMPYSWHLSAQNSQAITAMQWRFSLGQMLLQLLQAYSNLITVILLFGGLILYAPSVTLSALFFMFSIASLTYGLLRKRIDKASATVATVQQEENKATMTALAGIRELIIYQQQFVFLQAITKKVQAGMRPRTFLCISSNVPSWTLESGGFCLIWLCIYLLTHWKNAELTTITSTVALLALTAWRILPSLNRVVGSTVSIRNLQSTALPCLDYCESLSSATIVDTIIPDPNFRIKKEIIFERVSYRYPGAQKNALSNINCRIPVGTTLGLLGRSGAGKSTFINILSGLIEPTECRLLVDGKEMNASQLSAYRREIGYVPQNPYLLDGTVEQNIALCDWGKKINRNRVIYACNEASVDFLGDDNIDIERKIYPSNSGFSVGQIQRLSIARAIYSNPSLIIFDEATSSLDRHTEHKIQNIIINNKNTKVISAHRLSTLNYCDTILWIEHGTIKMEGRANDIISKFKQSTN